RARRAYPPGRPDHRRPRPCRVAKWPGLRRGGAPLFHRREQDARAARRPRPDPPRRPGARLPAQDGADPEGRHPVPADVGRRCLRNRPGPQPRGSPVAAQRSERALRDQPGGGAAEAHRTVRGAAESPDRRGQGGRRMRHWLTAALLTASAGVALAWLYAPTPNAGEPLRSAALPSPPAPAPRSPAESPAATQPAPDFTITSLPPQPASAPEAATPEHLSPAEASELMALMIERGDP